MEFRAPGSAWPSLPPGQWAHAAPPTPPSSAFQRQRRLGEATSRRRRHGLGDGQRGAPAPGGSQHSVPDHRRQTRGAGARPRPASTGLGFRPGCATGPACSCLLACEPAHTRQQGPRGVEPRPRSTGPHSRATAPPGGPAGAAVLGRAGAEPPQHSPDPSPSSPPTGGWRRPRPEQAGPGLPTAPAVAHGAGVCHGSEGRASAHPCGHCHVVMVSPQTPTSRSQRSWVRVRLCLPSDSSFLPTCASEGPCRPETRAFRK